MISRDVVVNLVIRFIRWNLSRRFDPFDWFVEHGDTWNVNFCSSSVYGSRLKEIPSTPISLSPIIQLAAYVVVTFSLPIEWAINMRVSQESNRSRNGSKLRHTIVNLFCFDCLCYVFPEERSAGLYHIHSTNKEEKLSGSSLCCFWYDIDRLYNTYFMKKMPDGLTCPEKCDCDVYHWYWCT